jgi:ABC-type Mn2+/Zn2+ transport system ATPase subunit
MGPEGSGADTYLCMLLYNARILAEGLGGQATNSQKRLDLILLAVIAAFFLAAFAWLALRIQRPKSADLPTAAALEVSSLTVAYDNKVVLNHFDLQLAPGKLYGLLGPNGSGKSTLFKSILGLVETDRSHIRLGGQPITDLHTHLAYVPQKEEIDWDFPATVYDVVLMGRYPHRRPFESISAADHQLVLDQLRALDIEHLSNKQIGELSGGQQQRVFIARALAQEAHWYFLDEPFVGVDITTEEKIMAILRQKVAKGATVVMIHHDLSKATAYFDAVVLINRRLVAFGPPAEVVTEANILAAFSGTQPLYDQAEQFNLRK